MLTWIKDLCGEVRLSSVQMWLVRILCLIGVVINFELGTTATKAGIQVSFWMGNVAAIVTFVMWGTYWWIHDCPTGSTFIHDLQKDWPIGVVMSVFLLLSSIGTGTIFVSLANTGEVMQHPILTLICGVWSPVSLYLSSTGYILFQQIGVVKMRGGEEE